MSKITVKSPTSKRQPFTFFPIVEVYSVPFLISCFRFLCFLSIFFLWFPYITGLNRSFPPLPSPISSISYCVYRHKVELKKSNAHRLLTTTGDTDGLFSSGGRTAWSSTVKIQGQTFAARYWYDGPYLNNAREDAAEVVIKMLDPVQHKNCAKASGPYLGQLWPQQRFWFRFELAWLESVRVVILFGYFTLLWWCCDCFCDYSVSRRPVFSFFFFSFFLFFVSYASFFVLLQSHATHPKRHQNLGLTEVCTTIVSIAGILHSTKVSQHAVPVNTVLGGWYVSQYLNVPRPVRCGSFSLSLLALTCATPASSDRSSVIHSTYSFPFLLRDKLNPKPKLKPFYELWRQIIMTHDLRWMVFFFFFFLFLLCILFCFFFLSVHSFRTVFPLRAWDLRWTIICLLEAVDWIWLIDIARDKGVHYISVICILHYWLGFP